MTSIQFLKIKNGKIFEMIPLLSIDKMSRMHTRENLRFAVRFLPLVLIVITIFPIIHFAFPSLRLSFEEFTVIFWSLTVVSFILNYQAMRWSKYAVEHYGPQREKNPIMRKMFAKGDLKEYWITWLGAYLFLSFYYIFAVNARVFFPSLIVPSLLLAIFLLDFLNDFFWLRKLKTKC
jgi:hypothetical protein